MRIEDATAAFSCFIPMVSSCDVTELHVIVTMRVLLAASRFSRLFKLLIPNGQHSCCPPSAQLPTISTAAHHQQLPTISS